MKKRFPDKFNESAAINRDLAAERRELEDKLEFTDPPSEPIPEPEETDGTMLQRIGTDGHLWAEAFVQRVQICNTANMDECAKLDLIDTMRAWFANAIEAGKSAGVQKERDDYERRANAGRYSGGESEHSEIIREITRS
ncbi:MAG TPA: hypothetical protein VHK27_07050 [Gammaproteobacteria bacterium]|nr:hypothetical protein [Gammaproteobacteria bacterium]